MNRLLNTIHKQKNPSKKNICSHEPETESQNKAKKPTNNHCTYSYFKCFFKYLISSLSRFSISESVIIYYPHGKYCLKQAPITHKAQAPKTHNIKVNLVPYDSSLYSLAKLLSFKSISFPKMLKSSFVAMFCIIKLNLSVKDFSSRLISSLTRLSSSFVAILSATADIIVSKVLIVVKACSSDMPDARNSLYRLIMSVLTIISAPLIIFDYLSTIVHIPNTFCKFISLCIRNCVYNHLIGAAYA